MRQWIGSVGSIQEEHPWFPVVVCMPDNQIEDFSCADLLDHFAGVRRDQAELGILLHGAHEFIRDPHGDVEIRDLVFVVLAGDELSNVRMVDAQHGHVRSTPCAALGNLAEGLIVDPEEPDRTGRAAHR